MSLLTIWVILALASVVMTSATNTIQEYIADRYPAARSLLVQYFFLAVVAAVVVGLIDGFALTEVEPWFIGVLIVTWLIGYLGIRLLFQALAQLDVGVVMMVAFSYVFFSYGINLLFFPTIEQLSLMRIILGVLFFVTISWLLLNKNKDGKGFVIEYALLLPLGTALCWAVYFGMINYYIKSWFVTPLQNIFYTEGTIFVVALLNYLRTEKDLRPLLKLPKRAIVPYAMRGVGVFLMGLFTYYAYAYAPGNVVNVIKLGSIILTAIFGRYFLNESLSKKEITLMGIAIAILAMFIVV